MLFEGLITEGHRHQFAQFVVHHLRVVIRIHVGLVLPVVQFLNESTGLVLAALYGLLQSGDDVRFFVFDFGFLGKNNRIDWFGLFFNRFYIVRLAGLKNRGEISPAGIDIELAAVIMINDFRIKEIRTAHNAS